jgi:hypothetical protein
MSAMMGALHEAFPETKPTENDNKTIVSGLDNPTVFEQEMKTAGFVDVNIERIRHSFPVENPIQFWKSMVKGSAPVTLLKSRTDPVKWQKREKIAVAWLAQHLGDSVKLYSTAFLATGFKSDAPGISGHDDTTYIEENSIVE